MATLNVRVSEDHYELLKQKAADEGQSLSEFIRDRLINAVMPVPNPDGVSMRARDDVSPETMTPVERQTLALLHRILAHVLPGNSNLEDGDEEYQLKRAVVLEEGFAGSYSDEFVGIRPELTKRQCEFVLDVLQMFRIFTFSLDDLRKQGLPTPTRYASLLEYRGFDHNHPVEAQMAAYVRFLMEDPHMWTELQPQVKNADNGNSHSETLDVYQRMLAEYARIRHGRDRGHGLRSYLLSADELQKIAEAAVHPSHRERQ